jgi:hypothetical protein
MLQIGRRVALLGMLAMTMAMAGCGDDDDDGIGPADITGTYTLRTVNNVEPPVTIAQGTGYKLEITGATMSLAAGGTFSQIINVRETTGTTADEYDDPHFGTWVRSGRTVTFTDEEDDVTTATVQNDGALVFSNVSGSGFTARFTK